MWLVWSAFVIALVGFSDASYLTVEHFRNAIPPCSITGGCENVLTSPYAVILGIPVPVLGAIYYLAILIGLFTFFDSKKEVILRWTLRATVLGFLITMWFLYVQQFLIHAYCQYCLLSALTSTLLFVIAIISFCKYRATDIHA
jgi:uncharacterized membrane protein